MQKYRLAKYMPLVDMPSHPRELKGGGAGGEGGSLLGLRAQDEEVC